MRLASTRPDHAALIALSLGLAACTTKGTPPDSAILPPVAVPVASVTAPPSAAPAAIAEAGVVVDLSDDGKITIDGVEVAIDAVRDAFAKKPREDVAVFRAGPNVEWKRIVHLIDQMKQAGNRELLLAIRNDPSRRTGRIQLPKAGEGTAPPAAPPGPGGGPIDFVMDRLVSITIDGDGKMTIDGVPFTEPLKDRLHAAIARGGDDGKPRIIVHGDARAPYGTIIDVTLAAQAENARVAFAVSAEPPPARAATPAGPRDSAKPHPKPKAFDACPFPAASDKAGIDTASVTLRVKVDAKGKVTDVAVVSDPGYGFGAAAKTCALQAAFDPAKDPSGAAMAGEAVIRVRFVR